MGWFAGLIAAWCLPAIAYAADLEAAAQQAWWQVALVEILRVTIAIAAPVLATLVAVLLRRIKLNVELEQLQKIASVAAGWAEQKAHQALAVGSPTPSAQKLQSALTYGAELARKYKLTTVAVERLEGLIEAKLGNAKLSAAGAPKNGTAA